MKNPSPNLLSPSIDFRDLETLIRGRIRELVDVILDQELNSAVGAGMIGDNHFSLPCCSSHSPTTIGTRPSHLQQPSLSQGTRLQQKRLWQTNHTCWRSRGSVDF